jgi:enamine deaminase RidA (YjgF/YER057c/UK114 family)
MARSANGLAFRSFRGASGCTEHYITIQAPGNLSLQRQIDAVAQRYAEALQTLRLAPESAIFRRIYLSDAANQADLLLQSSLFQEPHDSPVAIALVQQPPLPDSKVALLAYHLEGPGHPGSLGPIRKRQVSPDHVLVETGDLGHLWSTGLCAGNIDRPASPEDQTREVFDRLISQLSANGGSLAGNCVRTWIYVKDVDFFYQGMVSARTDLFDRHGLTRDTHYIASTGIEGSCPHQYDTVLMDAYSILGLKPEQVLYLNDFDHLCATMDYDVTFERGTRIAYADRAHHFISGTASIDTSGEVVHPGDVQRQLERTLVNIEALLRSGGARLEDMTHFLVYLRDTSDYSIVESYLGERFPEIPRLILRGPVCRPEWLIELEGIAVAPHDAPALPRF